MSNPNAKADWLAMVAIEREFPGLASSGPMGNAARPVDVMEGKKTKPSGAAMALALQKLTDRHRAGVRSMSLTSASRRKKRRSSFKRQRAGSA